MNSEKWLAVSVEGKAAFKVLDSAKLFCGELIGYPPQTPDELHAFRTILKEKHAHPIFKTLLEEATVAGQLYALCGLYYTDHDYFLRVVQPYRTSRHVVPSGSGCIGGLESVGRIVERDDPITVRLSSQHETVQEWVDRTRVDGMYYDIIGGAWPNILKESGGFRRTAFQPLNQ